MREPLPLLIASLPIKLALLAAFTVYATRPHETVKSQTQDETDRIVIEKAAHTLTLYSHGRITHTYKVALGPGNGPKQFQNDHKTPEGLYTVNAKNPHSQYHLALHLSYPNAADRAQAAAAHRSPGGDVEIHGLPDAYAFVGSAHRLHDWTDGCIAVTNPEIEEIYRLTPTNTPVQINP